MLVNFKTISHCICYMNTKHNSTSAVLSIQNIHTVNMIIITILVKTITVMLMKTILTTENRNLLSNKKNIRSSLFMILFNARSLT